MMKIVHVIPNLSSGGAERFVVDLLNEGTQNGWECYLVLFEKNNNFFLKELDEKVEVHFLEKKKGIDILFFYKIFVLLNAIKPTVIHSHLSAFNYLGLAMLFSRNKFFHTIHSLPSKEYKSPLGKILRILFFKLLKRCIPISISPKVDSEAKELYGNSVKMIFNGRSVPVLTDAHSDIKLYFQDLRSLGFKILVNIGSLKEAKNHHNLINSIKELNIEEKEKIKLIILGGDKDSFEYQNFSKIVDNNIELLGNVSNPQDYLKESDFFILPSLWEGMPISLIEAFALGIVSLGTDVGGISYMIKDSYNGFLIEGTQIDNIKHSIKRVIRISSEELRGISQNALFEYNKNYSIYQCYSIHNNIYQHG